MSVLPIKKHSLVAAEECERDVNLVTSLLTLILKSSEKGGGKLLSEGLIRFLNSVVFY